LVLFYVKKQLIGVTWAIFEIPKVLELGYLLALKSMRELHQTSLTIAHGHFASRTSMFIWGSLDKPHEAYVWSRVQSMCFCLHEDTKSAQHAIFSDRNSDKHMRVMPQKIEK
jgi:hypothetical protein